MNQQDIDNMFIYHAPDDQTVKIHQQVREFGRQFAQYLMDNVVNSADTTVAIRKIDEAVMAANAAIARNGIV